MSNIKIDVEKFNSTTQILETVSSQINSIAIRLKSIQSDIGDDWIGSSADTFKSVNKNIVKEVSKTSENVEKLAKNLNKICESYIEQDNKIKINLALGEKNRV